jgi:predicted ATPase/DNA-binding CsgD family transcriptional regulator
MTTSDLSSLPAEPNRFIGRERELAELRQAVAASRALTLCGPGGIGKTRLAGRMLAALRDEFPDGAWFVELGDLKQPDLVVSRVASVIGVVEESGRPLLDTLADALAPRTLLLTLDNCEHLIGAAARLCQRLLAAAPGLRIIATSREPLRVAAETVWPVPPLSVPSPLAGPDSEELRGSEAVRLFADRAASALPGFTVGAGNAAAVAALCRALDGVPLAVELAAAWVRVLSVDQIAGRLADLLATSDRNVPARHQTLRATIDWSHELLTPAERVMMRRLSVFSGWSLEMAETVCGDELLPAPDVLDLLAGLVDKSLVVFEPETLGQTRYRMLNTIREYAGQRLADAGEAAAVQARLRCYTLEVAEDNMAVGMALVDGSWAARINVFRRYDVDAANAMAVLGACLADGDAETGLRICTALRPCWLVRGMFAEGVEWFDSFLALDAPSVPAGVRGAALAGRAQLCLSSDPAAAVRWAEDGLVLCEAAGDSFWTGTALNLLAEAALHLGRPDEAALRAAEALALARRNGDAWNEGYALGSLAAAAGQRFNLHECEQFAEAALAVMRRIDQQWGVARTMLGLGDLARLRGELDVARQRYREALLIFREIDSWPEIARCLAGLARVALDQGLLNRAREHLGESIRLSHSIGSRIGVARGLELFAGLSAREERPGQALRLAAAASALRSAAQLAPLPSARVEQYLAAAGHLGELTVRQLWESGSAMTADEAVGLALEAPPPAGHRIPAPARPLPGQLTPRERQITELISEGMSNKAIAEQLVISPATAARHVANILAKLDFSSRSQIAAWATSAGGPARPAGGPASSAGGSARSARETARSAGETAGPGR